ncbi:hypothetical protein GSI_13318 [Ganoderma sinense ZZ0214-1]|uniref:Uncharacterized protein n=1 Tax=Ganoderma sinense ZZ0214-1 TaxID=1077348 RepID=A0A2G8RVS1_9APHY|nr:hypothetical protein GSI_13318 [Ganoderma sinense ZZ0214-1]
MLSSVTSDESPRSFSTARTDDIVHTPPTHTTTVPAADSPRVIFGAPPPRVLTIAPEKPPVKRRKRRAPAARALRAGTNKTDGPMKAKVHLAAVKDAESSQTEVSVTGNAEQQPAMPVSLALGRPKRVRVATARALDRSPDMSAANKLKRRTDVISGGMDEGADDAEGVEHPVKRRNTGSK